MKIWDLGIPLLCCLNLRVSISFIPEEMVKRTMDWQKHVHSDTKTLSGKPVVIGTRLSVEFLLSLFAAGWTEQQVLENYPTLTQESLRAVFAYAAESLKDEALFTVP